MELQDGVPLHEAAEEWSSCIGGAVVDQILETSDMHILKP